MVGSRDTHNYQPVHHLECGSEGGVRILRTPCCITAGSTT
ncbi:hypothetical protein CGRA01v4_04760 [Colletotrichum graminicola]|nr:hypothetical protein CGRA01v4_04760 [Colletotrichum graminicola]